MLQGHRPLPLMERNTAVLLKDPAAVYRLPRRGARTATGIGLRASLRLLPNLDLGSDVVLLLLDDLHRHVRAGHRRQAGDATTKISEPHVRRGAAYEPDAVSGW